MFNDYTGKVLHDAHYQDLLEESKGDQLLKAAPPDNEAGRPRWGRRRLAVLVTWLLIAALLAAGIAAAAVGAVNVT